MRLTLLVGVMVMVLAAGGCGDREITGTYASNSPVRKETLVLKPGGVLVQQVVLPDGSTLSATGRWEIADGWLHLNPVYSPHPITQKLELGSDSTNNFGRNGRIVLDDDRWYVYEKVKGSRTANAGPTTSP